MTTNDLKQHEFENDIQRFMQIREQVHEEIKKISTYATTLDQTNKRLVAHFDVFEKLSEETQEHMKVVIKEAAREMARESAQQFSQLIKDSITHRLLDLDRSVKNAQRVLDETMEDKYTKLTFFCFIGVIFSCLLGLGGGYYFAKQNTYTLPDDFIKTPLKVAMVSGNSILMRVPECSCVFKDSFPPTFSIFSRTIVIPRPRPDKSVIMGLVEMPD